MLRPIQRTRRSNEVFTQLRDGIVSGHYEPGARLPTERELCDQMQVNRTSVREALKRLEQARLVEVKHGSGTVVLDFRTHAGLELLVDLTTGSGEHSATVIRSILEVRLLIGPELARLSALRIQSVGLQKLRRAVEAVECAADASELQRADFAFHYALAEASENLALLLIVNSIRAVYLQYGDFFLSAFASPYEHRGLYRQIYDAVQERDAPRAEELDRQLLRDTNSRLWESNRRGE